LSIPLPAFRNPQEEGEPCLPFDPATATLPEIRAEITRLYDMELRELNECHQGAADWYLFEIRRLEHLHFERCYQAPPDRATH
jgi:hypothetical protein